MRRLAWVGALALGCTVENPEWDPQTTGASTGATAATSTGAATTGGTPTTGAGEGTGGVDGSTGIDGSTSGAPPPTSGSTGEPGTSETGTTSAPVRECMGEEFVPLLVPKPLISDTGVAPVSMNPCPWGGVCEQLNFGTGQFYRMLSTPELGENAALIRFDIGSLADIAAAHGRTAEDIRGFELELVVYEALDVPPEPTTLRVAAPRAENAAFLEGVRAGEAAVDGDSSELCRSRINGACLSWSGDQPVRATSVSLGTIEVTAENAAAGDYDGANNGRYHTPLRSSRLPIETIREVTGEGPPTFVVWLETHRDMGMQEFGIKLEDSPEPDPALYVWFCTKWDG